MSILRLSVNGSEGIPLVVFLDQSIARRGVLLTHLCGVVLNGVKKISFSAGLDEAPRCTAGYSDVQINLEELYRQSPTVVATSTVFTLNAWAASEHKDALLRDAPWGHSVPERIRFDSV